MFGLHGLLPVWTAALSARDFSFQNDRLKGALELYKEGQMLVANGEYNEGCDAIMTGVFSGRKIVEAMQLEDENNPESAEALAWLVASYVTCAEARISLQQWDKARSDAWAACMLSRNANLEALQCMFRVCKSTGDLFGQLSALKAIEAIQMTVFLALTSDDSARDGSFKSCTEEAITSGDGVTLKGIREKISQVEAALDQKMQAPEQE